MKNQKRKELDKRTINYKRFLEEQNVKPVKTLSQQLHEQVAKKTVDSLMKFAYITDQSYKGVNKIFNMSTSKDWFNFLLMTEGCTQIARAYSDHERATAQSFFLETVLLVNELYTLKENATSEENFFTHNMNFSWSI